MKIIEQIKSYFYEILLRTKRDTKKHIKVLLVSALIVTVTTFIGLKIIGINNALMKAVLIGIFNIIPIAGSSLILFIWIMTKVIAGGNVLAIQLSILLVIIIVLRQIMEFYIYNTKLNIRPMISFVIFIVPFLISPTKGTIVGMGLVFIESCTLEILDIEKYIRKYKRRLSKGEITT